MLVACPAALAIAACGGRLDETAPSSAGLDGGVFVPDCDEPQPTAGGGHHNPGQDCMECHRQNGGGPPFTFGGTAYIDQEGSAPAPGVTIHLVDAAGVDVRVVAEDNGNFWSTDPLGFPVTAYASSCPDLTAMVTPVAESDVGCNAIGCHDAGFRVSAGAAR